MKKKKDKRQKVVHSKQPLGQTKQMETGNKRKKKKEEASSGGGGKIFSRAEEKQQMGRGTSQWELV